MASSSGSTALTGWTTPPCAGYVTKDTVLGTVQFPIKTYTARIQLDDGSYVDLAPTAAPTSRA